MARSHPVIQEANELGYFPTLRQATEINCRWAELYAAHFVGRPPRGPVVEEIAKKVFPQACEEVMSRPRGRKQKQIVEEQ